MITGQINTHNQIPEREKVKILIRENNRQARWVKEALAIIRNRNTMNRDKGNRPISNIYHSLLTKNSDVTPGRSRTSALRMTAAMEILK